jgi:hypothetical protein
MQQMDRCALPLECFQDDPVLPGPSRRRDLIKERPLAPNPSTTAACRAA